MWFSSPEKNYNDLNAGDHRPVKEWKVIIYKSHVWDNEEIVHVERVKCKYEPSEQEMYPIYREYLKDHNLFVGDYDFYIEEVK